MRRFLIVPLAACALALCGCADNKPPATFKSEPHDHDHAHERGKMLLADAGPYHVGLTAHLSKEGNELDVLFETTAAPPKPVPLDLTGFKATAKTADGKQHELAFEPAPKDERKDDPDGKCSHFVAKAAWLKPDDVLTVTATVPINGKPTPVEWVEFKPAKYGHEHK